MGIVGDDAMRDADLVRLEIDAGMIQRHELIAAIASPHIGCHAPQVEVVRRAELAGSEPFHRIANHRRPQVRLTHD